MRRKHASHPGQGQLDFDWPAEGAPAAEAVQRPGLPVICGGPLWPRTRRGLGWDQCRWATEYGRQCARNGADRTFGVPFCFQHVKTAETSVVRYLYDNPHIVTDLYWEIFERSRLGELPRPGRSVVYFVERQGFVKIGTSTNLEQRLRSIGKGGQMIEGMTVGPVRLLATMPGDHRHESLLHGQFSGLRVEGEWFVPDTRLCDFIRRMRDVDRDLLAEVEIRHGLTDPEEDEEAS